MPTTAPIDPFFADFLQWWEEETPQFVQDVRTVGEIITDIHEMDKEED